MLAMSKLQQELAQQIRDAISDIIEEPEKIDIIAKIRGQYRVEEGSRYYALLQEYLSGRMDLPEAIERLFGPIYEGIHQFNQDERQFFDLWHSILHSAKRIPFQDINSHKRLVSFIGLYRKQPHPPNIHDYYGTFGAGIFGSLNGFSYTIERYWNDNPGHGSGCTEPEIHAWANLNYFLACITKENIYCSWRECQMAMRGALEYDMEKRDFFQKLTSIQLYEALVPAAAVWVFALRGTLYEKEMRPHKGGKNPHYGYGGPLYKGESGFNKERWRFWLERFVVISQMENLSEEVRKIAKEASDVMNQSEPPILTHRYELRPRKTRSADSDA
jgi:hypothetical protein